MPNEKKEITPFPEEEKGKEIERIQDVKPIEVKPVVLEPINLNKIAESITGAVDNWQKNSTEHLKTLSLEHRKNAGMVLTFFTIALAIVGVLTFYKIISGEILAFVIGALAGYAISLGQAPKSM